MAHGVKEDSLSWQKKTGSLLTASGNNGATGTATKTDKPYRVVSVYYNLVANNPDGIPRTMSMYASVNGQNVAQWSGSQSSTKTLTGTWTGVIDGLSGIGIACQAVSENNSSSATMTITGWEELV